MQTSARVVIIGGGIMGASLLYHLAELGWTDCLLIEKDELTSGSTWHAAGQCPSITGSYNLAKIHAYSNDLYPRLEGLTGQYVSWHKSGGIRLATNERELAWFKYIHGFSKIIGFDMEIIDPAEIRRINPFMTTEGVIAGARTTSDGHADPSGLCNAMAIGAKNMGAKIVRKTLVTGLAQLPSGEWDVMTDNGTVRAEIVVNAAGCYARQVAQMAGIDIPVTNMEHHYVVTDPIPAFMERDEEIPVMRCPYVSGYFRQEQKSGLIGVYENSGLAEAWAPKGQPEWASTSELFIDDLDRISKWLERAIERMPIFGEVGIRRIVEFDANPRALTLSDSFVDGVNLLEEFGWHFEINVNHTQMDIVRAFVPRVSAVPMILDHCGKPGIRQGALAQYRADMAALARHANLWIKLSDLPVEADHAHWSEADLRPYIAATLDSFGPDRIIFGGDYPICLQATTLTRWVEVLDRAFADLGLSEAETRKIYRDNANRFYRLGL